MFNNSDDDSDKYDPDNDDSDKYDPNNDDFEDDSWNEEDWENFFREEDERKRRLQELLDQYGFSEEGLRRAFQEMGYDLPEPDESTDEPEEQPPPAQDIDAIIAAEQSDWEEQMEFGENYANAHPLFRACHQLLLKVVKSMKHIWVDHRDHPIVVFQTGLFECMSKIIQAGYHDFDEALEAERGLILAALKRARKSLLMSLFTIPKLAALKILSTTLLTQLRNQIIELLQLINREIIFHKQQN